MLFALICTDKPGHLEVRKANREAHVAYLKGSGVVTQAGPFTDSAGDMCGSLVVIDVADRAAAEAWAADDPYAKAELFSDVRIEAWTKVI
ncbi:MAG: YciI family protein [Pseudomonadota bacterium]